MRRRNAGDTWKIFFIDQNDCDMILFPDTRGFRVSIDGHLRENGASRGVDMIEILPQATTKYSLDYYEIGRAHV